MKVDASFPQVPLAAAPHKPPPRQTEQTSARPVDRPHHDEPANNQQTRETDPGLATSTLPQHAKREQSDAAEGREQGHRGERDSQPQRGGFSAQTTQPAPVGELLDVIA